MLVLACVAFLTAAAGSAQAQCDPVNAGVIAAVNDRVCGVPGKFTILSQSQGALGTSVFGGGSSDLGGSSGSSCTPLGCLLQVTGSGGCSYGYSWDRSIDGGPFVDYIPLSGVTQLAPYDSTPFASGYHVARYVRNLESSSGAPSASSNVVTITHYASYVGGLVAFNPGPQTSTFDLTIQCGGVAPAIGEGSPAVFGGIGNATPAPGFEYKWQAFYGGAWRDINYTVNGTFFPQGRPDLDAALVNGELSAHGELVGGEYVLKFRRLARPLGQCDFVPAPQDVTLRRPPSSPVVTTNADTGPGSLRAAVTFACDEDIVTFAPSVGGSTITLSSPITINRNLTIKGDGANRITIGGTGTNRAFLVDAGKNATLSGLDIVGVRLPLLIGVIRNAGNLNLRDMTFRDNQGGVDSQPGSTLRVLDSAFHGNDTFTPGDVRRRISGGGISAYGTGAQPARVEVINSTFSGNQAASGGAIACTGCDLILRNSTLTNNHADYSGGGLFVDDTSRTHSVNLSGTIIAANTATDFGPDWYSFGATVTSGGHNLIGNNADALGFAPAGTDRVGTPALPLAPKLAPLASNGGITKTHALQCASPAFDAGDPADLGADQIGQTPFGARRDIGAYESQQALEQASSGFRFQRDPADPLQVRFTDVSKGLPTAWSWDFGDGGTSPVRDPAHLYAAPGSYRACLTAASACGSTAAQCDPEVLATDVPQPVLDGQTIYSQIAIDSAATVGELRIHVDIKHTRRGDLRLTLYSPLGNGVVLKQVDVNDSAADVVGTYGADLASAQSLTAFEGQPARGPWYLEVSDLRTGETGTLDAWGLEICEARACLRADSTDVPKSGSLAAPATSTLQLPAGPPIDRVRARVDVSGFVLATGAPATVYVVRLELRSPAGTRITLFNGDVPTSQTRLVGTYGIDLVSLETLDAFQGQSPAGAWDLIASIRNPGFTTVGARINAWNLQVCDAGSTAKCRQVSICGPGFVDDGAGGCVDFDECVPFFNACSAGLTCVNQPGSFACTCVDDDHDGVCAGADNCPHAANADQADLGGIGAGSPPDGIGDACQCGDVTGDGRVTLTDAVVMTRSLLQPPTATLARPQRCDVGGSAGCSLSDAVIVRRALLSPPTATISQACAPANP